MHGIKRWLWVGLLSLIWMTQASASETYVVQKGDTLWDIAAHFLDEPWEWPSLWRASPDIENPHLIYPGDIVHLDHDDHGKVVITVTRGDSIAGAEKTYMANGTVRLKPRIRTLPADKAIPTLPLNVIGPFLNDAKVLTHGAYENAPHIVAVEEDHLMVGPGAKIYVSGLPHHGVDTYAIYREGKVYRHPVTDQILGVEADVLGRASKIAHGAPATLLVTQSQKEIKQDDRLIPYQSADLSPYFVPKKPNGHATGYIVSVFGGLNQIGQYQVVTLTGGRDIGRQQGDMLAIYQTEHDVQKRFAHEDCPPHIPPDYIGQVMVFRVFEKVSFGLVMKAYRAIYLHDEVRSP